MSRKNDQTQFGLLGGKVDPGEDPLEAIRRESREESRSTALGYDGIVLESPEPFFTRVCPGDVTYVSTTYFTHESFSLPPTPYLNDEGSVVDWVDEEVLLCGPFGRYNRDLLQHFKNGM